MNGVSSYTSQSKRSAESTNSILELGLAVAHIPRAKRVAEGDALAGVLGRFPMGRDHPQGADTELKTPTNFLFADCTRLLKCCTFRVAALVRRFRVPEGAFVSEARDETR